MLCVKSLHKLASPVLYGSGVYRRLWSRNARKRPFTLVLAYHRVVADGTAAGGRFGIERGVSAGVFEAQIRFMLKHFVPIRAAQALDPPSARLHFAVTLDDGYEDNFRVAAPILRRLGIPATFYVVSDFVGTDRLFWWEQLAAMMRATPVPRLDVQATLPELEGGGRLPAVFMLHTDTLREQAYEHLCKVIRADAHEALPRHLARLSAALEVKPREEGRDYGLMNWAQLRELVSQGHEIGGHTATHCNVVGLDEDMLQREILSSLASIEGRLDTPVLSFAYPYGHFDRARNAAGKALANAGCSVAFTSEKGVVHGQCNAFELPRGVLNRRFGFACAYNVQDTLNSALAGR